MRGERGLSFVYKRVFGRFSNLMLYFKVIKMSNILGVSSCCGKSN